MSTIQQSEGKTEDRIRLSATPMDWFILILVLLFVCVFNATAMYDRLLLFLYSMGVVGAAFVLLKRGALVFTAMALAAAATALLVNVYFQTFTESWHPTVDAVRDFVGVSIIAFVVAKLIQEIHRIQLHVERVESKDKILNQEVNTAT